jgi:hypothetical protein
MSGGTRGRMLAAAAAAIVVLVSGGAALASSGGESSAAGSAPVGQATREAAGTPDYCPRATGVTVVVDFQELGGGIVVRCAQGPVVPGYTGLDALQDAGFHPEGVRRYGFAFICRIAGKPAPDQTLPIQGDPNYKEACINTPPPSAFWGYWYAPNRGTWTYSQVGALSRDAIPGGFEGWSFSLNHTQDSAPAPGIAPERPPRTPPTTPPPTSPSSTSPPPTSPPPTRPAHGSGGTSPGHGSPVPPPESTGTQTTDPAQSPGRPTSAASVVGREPTPGNPTSSPILDPVAVGHNAAGERVSGELPHATSTQDGSARTAIVGIGIVALLAAGAGIAALRRRAGRG